MKKLFLGLFLGFVIHMLYLDGILIHQHIVMSKCDVYEQPNKDGVLPCLRYANETPSRFYLKYFGIYQLIDFPHEGKLKFRFE